ncbi:hypothetical protein OG462_35865 [Streptomyces sp. NBC_01077]|uniref:hypothetical protein n=1 Tax=Streptomyces sp. NBC_01077 TaxID=2903746 RepID=UPI003870952A|nr:hypothetical protein OG462_35865 [Streptomyces sp. NBC_01077]
MLRYVVGGTGLAMIGLGAWLVVEEPDPVGVSVWLAGAVVLHDGILAPLVLAVGLLLAGRRVAPERGLLRGALIVAGSVVLVTLPLLVRPGEPPNPSALPLPYGRNLAIVLAAVAAATGALYLVRRRHGPVRSPRVIVRAWRERRQKREPAGD